ncbi:hypothetical protein GCM10010339_68960 [Streptomyces alanosinicus]|uniref:Uncharacterized protein n=1 Tax=Streptomyces alanosinicus TaxID=68171 RepID=A0A919D552_9ACTN|nr:hypothetical protein GCM10010339_68960 [Streptomyces alanosinicus]
MPEHVARDLAYRPARAHREAIVTEGIPDPSAFAARTATRSPTSRARADTGATVRAAALCPAFTPLASRP